MMDKARINAAFVGSEFWFAPRMDSVVFLYMQQGGKPTDTIEQLMDFKLRNIKESAEELLEATTA